MENTERTSKDIELEWKAMGLFRNELLTALRNTLQWANLGLEQLVKTPMPLFDDGTESENINIMAAKEAKINYMKGRINGLEEAIERVEKEYGLALNWGRDSARRTIRMNSDELLSGLFPETMIHGRHDMRVLRDKVSMALEECVNRGFVIGRTDPDEEMMARLDEYKEKITDLNRENRELRDMISNLNLENNRHKKIINRLADNLV